MNKIILSKSLLIKTTLFMAVFGFLAVLKTPNAFAATKTWTGSGSDSNFSTATNWSPTGAPSSGDDLVFDTTTMGTSAPLNDITGLSLNSIKFNGNNATLKSISLTSSTIIMSTIDNSSNSTIHVNGGFTLGGDVIVRGVSILGQVGGSGDIKLANHKFTNIYGMSGVNGYSTAINLPITGNGTVEYKNFQSVQLGAINTYSGVTNISSEQIISTISPINSQHPSQMFGTSTLNIDNSSSVKLNFGTSSTFSNTINLSDTTVSNGAFIAQLEIQAPVGAAANIALTGIVLNGKGGISIGSDVASVNLAGIQTNGNCLYIPTINTSQVLNAPAICDGASTSIYDTNATDVPGAPDTGNKNKSNAATLLLFGIAALIVSGTVVRQKFFAKRK